MRLSPFLCLPASDQTCVSQEWRVFIRIEELFILVPILLNLKGNLEMNLAARFSTSVRPCFSTSGGTPNLLMQANIGELDMRLTRRSLIFGNLALLQVQALLVSLLSGLLAFLLGVLSRNGVHHALQNPIYNPLSPDTAATDKLRGSYFEALLLLCVSMLAASISSAVLGSFMCALVVLCRKFKINPGEFCLPPYSTSLTKLQTTSLRRSRLRSETSSPSSFSEASVAFLSSSWVGRSTSDRAEPRVTKHLTGRNARLNCRIPPFDGRDWRQPNHHVPQRLRSGAPVGRLGTPVRRHGNLKVSSRSLSLATEIHLPFTAHPDSSSKPT